MVPMTVNRRFVELGPRLNDFNNRTLQYTIGLGDLPRLDLRCVVDPRQCRPDPGAWQLGLDGQGTAGAECAEHHVLRKCRQRLRTAERVGRRRHGDPAMLGFVNSSAILLQSVQQDVGSFNLSGDLGEKFVSPWAGQPITMAVSGEERKVQAGTQSDAASQIQGEVLGTGAPTPDRVGTFRLRELAIETQIPLVKDKPFIRALNADLGYRETEFKTGSGLDQLQQLESGRRLGACAVAAFPRHGAEGHPRAERERTVSPKVTGLSNLAVDPCQKGGKANPAEVNTRARWPICAV
jgi:hypothetical protein